MNFYIDFEATQFTEEIISIGCVAENGNTFNCLVVPSDLKKITPFITKLTGITREMVEEEGYSPEMAFCHLMTFVKENNGDELPVYYCYGNQDKTFLKNTINHMHNFNMMVFASSVRDMMVDYSVEKNMNRFLLLFVFMLGCGVASAQQMNDDQVVEYVMSAQEKGRSQQQIAAELMRRGVTMEQISRIKRKMSTQEKTGVGKTLDEKSRMRTASHGNGAIELKENKDAAFMEHTMIDGIGFLFSDSTMMYV